MSGDIDGLLEQSFQDFRFSRNEKQSLQALLEERPTDARTLGAVRAAAFRIVREHVGGPQGGQSLAWLEEVCQTLLTSATAPTEHSVAASEACFTPGFDAPARIAGLFRKAARKVDVCVFTITDNTISRAIRDAQKRGIKLRIITDNDKSRDLGSDVAEFQNAGIPVRVDRSEFHMHHKFALFDDGTLLTGSYNWTRGAAEQNHENFLITDDARLCKAYSRVFEKLWSDLE